MRSESKTEPKKDLPTIVVGGGPIGLFTALRLHELGKKIMIIEPRPHYKRPGYLTDAFGKAGSLLKMAPPRFEGSIKDFERWLFQLVTAREIREGGITVARCAFDSVKPGGIEVSLSELGKHFIACDEVIDCTGTARAVLRSVNREMEEKKEEVPFVLTPAVPNPKENMILITGRMRPEDIEKLMKMEDELFYRTKHGLHDVESHNTESILSVTELRNRFQWEEHSAPFFRISVSNHEKNKVILYLEQPKDLKPEDLVAYVNANLKLRLNQADVLFVPDEKESKKYGVKPRREMFAVQPKKVQRAFYQIPGYPIVIPLGDSQIDPEFRVGNGILHGINRVEELRKALLFLGVGVKRDISKLNLIQYQDDMDVHLRVHEKRLRVFYDTRQLEFDRAPQSVLAAAIKILEVKEEFPSANKTLQENQFDRMIVYLVAKDLIKREPENKEAANIIRQVEENYKKSSLQMAFLQFLDFAFEKKKLPTFTEAKNIYNDLAHRLFREKYQALARRLDDYEDREPREGKDRREALAIREKLTQIGDQDIDAVEALNLRLQKLIDKASERNLHKVGLLSSAATGKSDADLTQESKPTPSKKIK